ncbi:MAG: A/G-specific adenine glycosylase [Pseudomonadota bacterium]
MKTTVRTDTDPATSKDLIAWYDRHARDLPWRVGPKARQAGVIADPYAVWLSEIMLQQTTVKTVGPYFARFLKTWPTLADLAAAEEEAVLRAWAGLGYYSRARNLKKCAEVLVADHDGKFPESAALLEKLPGIGAYTSAAIAAIAFDEQIPVVDGNVERVIARLHAIETPLPAAKKEIRSLVDAMTPKRRPGDFAQAMMDLGATICSPRRPACSLCPLNEPCVSRKGGYPETYPRKAAKREKPTRYGAAFAVFRADGAILMRKRPDKGLLAGMTEIPTGIWREDDNALTDLSPAPVTSAWRREPGLVRHTFTHFHLQLAVYTTRSNAKAPDGAWWSAPDEQGEEALPTVMRKVLAAANGD